MSDAINLSKNYDAKEVENRIYQQWLQTKSFQAVPDKRDRDHRYVIMMPLPNVTGALHMGHAMDNVMQDLLTRWHRMKGDNSLWMPGTDHAGIATQAVVEKRLKEIEGITRHDIGREGLIKRIWEWKDQYQARIVSQQQRMGCSCDWDRQRFTMDKICARAVRHSFFKMFADGLIYRGKKLVNWDPFLRTTISDDEMYYETIQGHFWHLMYPVINPKEGEPQHIIVATTRPETMLGDTAVAVHPDPEGYLRKLLKETQLELEQSGDKHRDEIREKIAFLEERIQNYMPYLVQLKKMAEDGREVMLPLMKRPIPLILDEWAKPELGSGCVKITPAHDYNDYEVWTRHKEDIDIINILNHDGTLNENAGHYQGQDRFEAREKVLADLEAQGLLHKVEDREVEMGHSDRSKKPVEPFLSDQWFINMGDVDGGIVMGRGTPREFKAPGLVQAAMDAVIDKRVQIHPERYTKTYLDWLSEKRDWPISRQLWWGHRIPVWAKTFEPSQLILSEIQAVLKEIYLKRPEAEKEILLRLYSADEENSLLLDGKALLNIREPEWTQHNVTRADFCLLKDSEDLMNNLESMGFEQDPDVLDTWFSSALWPFSTLGWPDPETAELEQGQSFLGSQMGNDNCLEYFYPGGCLVTGRDIITLWVARMVLAGLYNIGDIPFSDVFIHANILDGKGVRMSKSKGNGIDPVDIIEGYGTDAMRYVLCDMQTGTQDIKLPVTAICPVCGFHNDLGDTIHGSNIFCYVCGKKEDGSMKKGGCGAEFDVLGTLPNLPAAKLTSEKFEIGRSFCTKLWNSARFAFMNLKQEELQELNPNDLLIEDKWILHHLSLAVKGVNTGLEEYNPSIAINTIREFFWSALCDWYLEIIKPRLYKENETSGTARQVLAFCLDQVLRLLHPFVPFITEELWQKLGQVLPSRKLNSQKAPQVTEMLITAPWPLSIDDWEDSKLEADFVFLQDIIRGLRDVRAARNIPPKEKLKITIKAPGHITDFLASNLYIINEMAGLSESSLDENAERPKGSASKLIGECMVFVHDVIDESAEKSRLEQALADIEKEILGVQKKLANPQFVEKAPEAVVEKQKARLADCENQKQTILDNLSQLG